MFASARDLSRIEHLAALDIETISLDVTDSESILIAIETVKEKAGTLDCLINSSGIGMFQS